MKKLDCLGFEGEERVGGQDGKEKTGSIKRRGQSDCGDVDYFS